MRWIQITVLTFIMSFSINCAIAADEAGTSGDATTAAAIKSLQAIEPQNMDEFMEHALLFSKLWRNDLAQKNFAKVLELNPKEEDLIRLHEMGIRILPKYLDELSDSPDLQPAGSSLADKIQEALHNRYRSEEAIDKAVKEYLSAELGTDSSRQAFSDLNRTSDLAAAALLEQLHKKDASTEIKKKAAVALSALDASARDSLIASLDSQEPEFVGQCITILGARNDNDILMFLYGFTSENCSDFVKKAAVKAIKKRAETVLGTVEASTMLVQHAKRALDGDFYPQNSIDDQAVVWSWNAEKGKPVHTLYPVRLAQLLRAVRLARGAYSLMPDNKTIERVYWTAEAEFLMAYPSIARELMGVVSLDSLVSDKQEKSSLEENIVKINSLLDYSLQFRYNYTAQKACQMLEQIKSPQALTTHGEVFSPLVRALNSQYPPVRWAACQAIMAINPQTPYLGSSELPKTLAWFLLGEGRKKILIAAPKSVDALAVGGYLPENYEMVIATKGKQALMILQNEPEIYAVFYSMNLYSVPPAVFLEKIRNIPQAANVPVVIMSDSNRFEEAKKVVRDRPMCFWTPTPSNVADMDRVMEQLDAFRPYPMLTPEQMVTYADSAAKYGVTLATMCYGDDKASEKSDNKDKSKQNVSASKPSRHDVAQSAEKDVFRKMYDLKPLIDAAQFQLANNLSVDNTLEMLKNVPMLDAQKQIVDYASNGINSLENRQKAVDAFKYSVNNFGLLLLTPQLTLQYDLHKLEKDKDSKKILNSILDVIEGPWNIEDEARKQDIQKAVNSYYGDQPNFKAQ